MDGLLNINIGFRLGRICRSIVLEFLMCPAGVSEVCELMYGRKTLTTA